MDEHGNLLGDHPHRPAFHFQPQKNWINDPNAPLYYKGFYHLFYQNNPLNPFFDEIIIWGHSVSQDLVNWVQLEPALTPSPSEPFDINSCWSGSATILPDGKPVLLYTGIDNNRHQVTVLAEPQDPSDPLLRKWVKSNHNPVMIPPVNVPVNDFRDPTTAWQGSDGKWRVIIGASENNNNKDKKTGLAILYHSNDFITWTEFNTPLYSSDLTGMWECPDFYPVSLTGKQGIETSVNNSEVKHVLKASFKGRDCYVIGTYSSESDEFKPDSEFSNTTADLRLDHGIFYASKAFFDSFKNRRINWGWVIDTDTREDAIQRQWAGIQTLPREIWLDRSGKKLVQWPVEEINYLRTKHVSLELDARQLQGGSILEITGITASQADVEVTFDLTDMEEDNSKVLDCVEVEDEILFDRYGSSVSVLYGPFGLLALASNDLSEHTAIFFKVIRRGNGYSVVMSTDSKKSSLRDDIEKHTRGTFLDIDPRHEKITLRCLIDHSVIESYGDGGKSVITSRAYPQLAIGEATKLYLFNDGTQSVTISSLDAWSMRKAQMNSNPI